MGPNGIILLATAAGAATAGVTVFGLGAPFLAAGAATLLGAVGGASALAAVQSAQGRRAAEARFDTLASEMVLIRQRQAEFDAKLLAVDQRTVESPALVWRAATADIQVLGSLVSDLAKTVAEHDEKLGGSAAPAAKDLVLPSTTPPPPSWFEDEAELGFTSDIGPLTAAAPAPEPAPSRAPSPAVISELKSTLAAALMSDRLELCLQPYVTLPQRKVAGYEATLSLKAENGALQGAAELRAAARAAGMDRDLDRILVERTGQVLRVLRARDRIVAVTCAVSGDSLLDPAFRSAVEAVARSEGKLAQNVMLAFPLADAARLKADGAAALEALKRTGVTLGAVATGPAGVDAAALERLGVIELRLPATAMLADPAGAGDIHPADLGEMLERRNIRMLLTGVESESAVRDLLDFAAALAQGDLFGAARPVRPEVLQPRPVGEPGAGARIRAAQAPADAPGARRQSFRSLLRRA
jgi:cyclic-di-GMP phosphodiesterase, flagellum assembly factor TipF